MTLGNSPNCIAALFEAAASWTTVGSEEQTALGEMTLEEVNNATNTWSQAKFALEKGEAYSEIPTSIKAWMSPGILRSMANEGLSEAAEISKVYVSDLRAYNSTVNWSHTHGGSGGSQEAGELQALNAMKPLYSMITNIRNGAINGQYSYQTEGEKMFLALATGNLDGTVPDSYVTDLKPEYLHHQVTGAATIQQLTDHVKELYKEKATAQKIQAATDLLDQAQVWQEDQTACANAGVEQAQGYLTTATDGVVSSLNALRGLVAMLKLSQRQLAR